MTQEKSPLKGFKSLEHTPSKPNNQNIEKKLMDHNLSNNEIIPSYSNNESVSNTSNRLGIEANVCSKCGKENDKSHSFCSYCGVQIIVKEDNPSGFNFLACPSCGKENPDDAIKCNYCGKNISQEKNVHNIPSELSENVNEVRKIDPFVVPPTYDKSSSGSKQTQSEFANKRFPTVSTTDYKNKMKNGKIGLVSIPILLLLIFGLVFGGLAIGLIFDELNVQALSTFGFILFGLGYLVHAVLGFVGLFRLFFKGWTLEVLGCMLIGGGSPILFPILFGILFYIFAEILPNKHK